MTEFCFAGYRRLIEEILDRGYAFRDFHRIEPGARHVVSRHDVDFSTDCARRIAELEAELGVSAVQFFLVHTEMYNVRSRAAAADIRRIAELGHEIGLHFDATSCADEEEAMDAGVRRECAILEDVAGQEIRMVSFHRPARRLLGRADPIGGRRHAYEPCFFSEMGYCSDSRGAWGHGHPLDHPALAEGRALQLLTHPIWWARETELDPVAALDAFRRARDEALGQAIADNCDPYREALAAR